MKKIGILSVLILCLVIGGVYATWSFAGQGAAETTSEVPITLTNLDETGSKGDITLDANKASDAKLFVDDTDNDHFAEAVTGSGNINIEFVPSAAADTDIATYGIVMEYVLSADYALESFTFNEVQVFTAIDGSAQKVNNGDRCLKASIPASEIAALITVNPNLKINSKAEYNSFVSLLSSHGLKLTIREVVAP